MSATASQITSLTIVFPTVYSGTNETKDQSSASLALVRGMLFQFDDVIMAQKDCIKPNGGRKDTTSFHEWYPIFLITKCGDNLPYIFFQFFIFYFWREDIMCRMYCVIAAVVDHFGDHLYTWERIAFFHTGQCLLSTDWRRHLPGNIMLPH